MLLLVVKFKFIFITLSFIHFRIGLCGFDNPMRDSKTEEMKRHIGQVSSCLFAADVCVVRKGLPCFMLMLL